MRDRRDHFWSDLFYALTTIGLIVLWFRFVARLAYRFGIDYTVSPLAVASPGRRSGSSCSTPL